MQAWFDRLPVEIFKDPTGEPHWLVKDEWFPENSCIVVSESGSMTKALIPILVEHINTNIRKIIPVDKRVCLVLDGHSSRKGWDWLETCVSHNIEVVQSPANTSHFLSLVMLILT